MSKRTDLSGYNNSWYHTGASVFTRLFWYLANALVLMNPLFLSYGFKRMLLRLFGAKVGSGLIIKPRVNIKYPWKLQIGDHVWIGENVWIDNLEEVRIGSNVCLSQGALLLTGNHNYKKTGFDLMVKRIELEEGVWIGAKAVVSPGVKCHSHAILTVNSVATGDLDPYGIYQGNPAVKVKDRVIE